MRRNLPSLLAGAWLVVVVVATVSAPLLAPQGSNAQDLTARLQGPSLAHPFGTDSFGRDLLVRLIYGAQPTLITVIIVLVVTLALGALGGLAAGYLRGRADDILSTVSDVLQSVPALLISLVVFAIFPYNLFVVMGATAIFLSPFMFRVVRGATLSLGNELYVTSARATGLSHSAILRRHLAPRLAELIRVQASMMAAVAITTSVGLGFLGLDVALPAPSWGGILAEATQFLVSDVWFLVPPLAVVAATIVAFGVLGDAVGAPYRPPRSRRRRRRPVRGEVLIPKTRGTVEPDSMEHPAPRPAVSADTLLKVTDLTVTTHSALPVDLVDGVGFEVRRGEVLGIVGESGAGKSVIVRSLVRVFRNTTVSGSAVLGGIDLVGASESDLSRVRGRQIAYVGQDPLSALDPLFKIGSQLIEAVRAHRGLDKAAAKEEALRLLAAVRIPSPAEVYNRYSFELSGGQAQRVAIALALAGDPDLLIADEPTTALDVTIQMEVLGLLKDLQRTRGLAIILVTHDWGVVADMCDRVLTVYAGEVVEQGAIEDVFARPAHPYTAALREADPHLQPAGARLTVIPGRMPPAQERSAGCRFAPRCELAIEGCRSHPVLRPIDPMDETHLARCIRAEEVEVMAHV